MPADSDVQAVPLTSPQRRTLAEIGDPHRFADGSRLASYAGLAPVDWQSGRSAQSRKPRGGNHRLKNAMFTAAFVATQHDPDARAYYQRKRSQGKRHNAGGVRLARRLEVEGACEEGGHLCSCDGLVGAEPPRLASAANSDPGREQCLDVGGVHTGGIRVREPRRP